MAEKEYSEVEVFEKMMAETDAVLPEGLARGIEKDVTNGGDLAISRRLALEYLEKPFRETTEKIRNDRGLAVATAHVADVLEGHIASYEALVGFLKVARTRMVVAIAAAREDWREVTAEAKADAERENARRAREFGAHVKRVK